MVKKYHAKPGGKKFHENMKEQKIKMEDVYIGKPFVNRAFVSGKN